MKGEDIAEKPSADCAELVIPANRLDPWVKRKNGNGAERVPYATVAYRHSRQKHVGMTWLGQYIMDFSATSSHFHNKKHAGMTVLGFRISRRLLTEGEPPRGFPS